MPSNQNSRLTAFALAAAFLCVLPGCPQLFNKNVTLSGSGMDMFTPVTMRIHPLSRVIEGPAPRVQGRLELTDQMGDVGKGVGVLKLDLFSYELLPPGHRGRLLGTWTIPINAPEANRAHWDAITRTYLFDQPLGANALHGNGKYILIATLTLPNGSQLKADAIVGAK